MRLAVGPQLVDELQMSPAAASTGSDLDGGVVGEVVFVVDEVVFVVDEGAVVVEGAVVLVVVDVVIALDEVVADATSTTSWGAFVVSRLPKCLLFSLMVVSSML